MGKSPGAQRTLLLLESFTAVIWLISEFRMQEEPTELAESTALREHRNAMNLSQSLVHTVRLEEVAHCAPWC